jgi:hypothetical protein
MIVLNCIGKTDPEDLFYMPNYKSGSFAGKGQKLNNRPKI